MTTSDQNRLGRLGSGDSIEAVCDAAGIDRAEFDRWWTETIQQRGHVKSGRITAGVESDVSIHRDSNGIPHIHAKTDRDLFFGYGWAMAEDRLFQLDWLRRKGHGRLSEIIGADGLEVDTVSRTVGLNRIAAAEWERLPAEVQQLLEAFSDGINSFIGDCGDKLPIEFDLLKYRPEPWSPVDCLAIEVEFRWYLTGRFPVICMPELAKRTLGEGPLLREYLLGEEDQESILHPGDYKPLAGEPPEPIGETVADPDASTGSNNWVVSGRRTTTGAPLLASDPHIAFEAVSCWYEAHLCGGSFNVAGMTYVGMPAIMFGRNEQAAWGITNNICSLRDLYQERTDDSQPGCFEYDGQWERAREVTETITVRDGAPVRVHRSILTQRSNCRRHFAGSGERTRSRLVELARYDSRRMADFAARHEPCIQRQRTSRGDAALACADVFTRARRHGRSDWFPRGGPHSGSQSFRTSLSTWLGS